MVFLFTVISVSLDAYYAGISFNLGEKLTLADCIYASFYTLATCLIASALRDAASGYTAIINKAGGALLIAAGIKYLTEAYYGKKRTAKALFKPLCGRSRSESVTLMGLSVSADAAAAAVALPAAPPLLCALAMFVFHAGFLLLGGITAKPLRSFEGATVAAGIFLTAAGTCRILL